MSSRTLKPLKLLVNIFTSVERSYTRCVVSLFLGNPVKNVNVISDKDLRNMYMILFFWLFYASQKTLLMFCDVISMHSDLRLSWNLDVIFLMRTVRICDFSRFIVIWTNPPYLLNFVICECIRLNNFITSNSQSAAYCIRHRSFWYVIGCNM